MRRLYISVEGQTEETFVKNVLAAHLQSFDLHPTPIIVKTRRDSDAPSHKGGGMKYSKVKNEIRKLLLDTCVVAVTTMYDFYGLPTDFPGCQTVSQYGTCFARIAHCEAELSQDINDHRFLPYLMLHEFEAMLFVSPEAIAASFPDSDALTQLQQVRNSFASPEEINDDPTTAPSKRLLQIFDRAYRKPLYGSLITQQIGLNTIRCECLHFDEWLTRLETL